MGSPTRLLAPTLYGPALVSVVFGINAPSVPRRKIRREPYRKTLLCHRLSWVCPSLLLQSDFSFLTSRLEHRYAASFRSVYKPSGVCEKILPSFIYRLIAAATNRLSTFLSFLASLSERSLDVRAFPASRRQSAIKAGILPGLGPLSLRVLLRFLPPLDSASRSFWRSSSNSRSRIAIASRMTWASISLITGAYLLPEITASVHSSVTRNGYKQAKCNSDRCTASRGFCG